MLIGIVGKPNCGKSTFFKAMTLAEVEIGNRPFVTLKPNHGIGYVKINDVAIEFGKHANPREGYVLGNYRFVPVELLDVAGLVPGAYQGKGMGNQFLNDLNQADALIHVIDVSGGTNERGEPLPENNYDPAEDIKFLELELDMWFLQIINKGWEKFSKTVKYEGENIVRSLAKQLSGLQVTEGMVKEAIKGFNNDPTQWNESELKHLASHLRKKAKPMIIAANKIDVPGAKKNLERLKIEFPDYKIIGCSAAAELTLKETSKKEFIKYIPGENNFEITNELNTQQKNALNFLKETMPTGVQNIMDTIVFDILKYIAIHPGGVAKLEDSKGRCLPDCFLMPINSTALDFAYKLHTDFGKNFIRAIDVKTKKTVGKEHILKHLDIIELIAGK
ncbi:redox-regulated ATPase YchF [Candidatus Woesearchaeota archaeon]|nr:redox-regulated ATPase YchF [Candidatus Woesearchaeota archaeon]